MENLEKSVFSFLLIIGILWGIQWLFFWILSFFSENDFLNDFLLFLYPPIITIGMLIYSWIKKEKVITISILVGGGVFYIVLLFSILWGLGEMGCTRYFFNLFTTCP